MSHRDVEGLRQFSRPRAEAMDFLDAAPRLHQRQAAAGLEGANQNESVPRAAFHKNVQHPVHAVIEIDVGCAGGVALDETTRARPRERVAGFIVQGEVAFSLDDNPRAVSPNQLRADEFARANKRIALKEGRRQDRPFYFSHDVADESSLSLKVRNKPAK